MDTQRITNQQCKALELQILHDIEVNAREALIELGLEWSDYGVIAARRRMRDESPLYVCIIEVYGGTARDLLYDDCPGLNDLSIPRCLELAAPPYCSLPQAKKLVSELLRIGAEKADIIDECDCRFCPSSVILRSQFNSVIDEYHSHVGDDSGSFGAWSTEVYALADPVELGRRAQSCVDEASYEVRGDNLVTALGLCARAAALLRMVEIAENRDRVIA